MSHEKVFPSDLVPIKNVDDEKVQAAGRFAVEEHNRRGGHNFIYKRVVNGLSSPNISAEPQYYILVLEAINDKGIPWSYIAKVQYHWILRIAPFLFSFEDVLKDFNKH